MGEKTPIASIRPPSYMNAHTLAAELDISESQVYSLVRSGVLPRPTKLSSGCARWSWHAVQIAIESMGETPANEDSDPFMRRISHAAKEAKDRRSAA